MPKVLQTLISIIICFSLLGMIISIPQIFNDINKIKKIENIMVKYAQKNGGFISSEIAGDILSPQDLLNRLVADYRAEEIIHSVEFMPGLEIPVQKKEVFIISVIPKLKINVPFGKDFFYIGKKIEREGRSHKYWKV